MLEESERGISGWRIGGKIIMFDLERDWMRG
jgi:hypothetical protein